MGNDLDSLSSEGLERIAEVDPTVVLELLDESLVERGNAWSNVLPHDEDMPRSRVDNNILRSELNEKRIGRLSKQPLFNVDAHVADGRLSKSVAFQLDDEIGRLFCAGCELVGVSDAEQSLPSSSQPDGIDYGTSDMKSTAGRHVDDVSETRVYEA